MATAQIPDNFVCRLNVQRLQLLNSQRPWTILFSQTASHIIPPPPDASSSQKYPKGCQLGKVRGKTEIPKVQTASCDTNQSKDCPKYVKEHVQIAKNAICVSSLTKLVCPTKVRQKCKSPLTFGMNKTVQPCDVHQTTVTPKLVVTCWFE